MIFIRSNDALLEAWEFDQYENRWLDATTAAHHNKVDTAHSATRLLEERTRNWPSSTHRIVDNNPTQQLMGDTTVGTRPAVSDAFTRVTYTIYRDLVPDGHPLDGQLHQYADLLASEYKSDPTFGKRVSSAATSPTPSTRKSRPNH